MVDNGVIAYDFRCPACRLLDRHDLCDWLRGCECAAPTCLNRLRQRGDLT